MNVSRRKLMQAAGVAAVTSPTAAAAGAMMAPKNSKTPILPRSVSPGGMAALGGRGGVATPPPRPALHSSIHYKRRKPPRAHQATRRQLGALRRRPIPWEALAT